MRNSFSGMSWSTPVKTGFLRKAGDLNPAFQRRWFVLQGDFLFYFKTPRDSVPKGFIPLSSCTLSLSRSDSKYEFCITSPHFDRFVIPSL